MLTPLYNSLRVSYTFAHALKLLLFMGLSYGLNAFQV